MKKKQMKLQKESESRQRWKLCQYWLQDKCNAYELCEVCPYCNPKGEILIETDQPFVSSAQDLDIRYNLRTQSRLENRNLDAIKNHIRNIQFYVDHLGEVMYKDMNFVLDIRIRLRQIRVWDGYQMHYCYRKTEEELENEDHKIQCALKKKYD